MVLVLCAVSFCGLGFCEMGFGEMGFGEVSHNHVLSTIILHFKTVLYRSLSKISAATVQNFRRSA